MTTLHRYQWDRMTTPVNYTLRQAAEVAHCSKSTIQRALKSGKLSAQRKDDGSYSIDPSELARVFTLTAPEQASWDTVISSSDTPSPKADLLEQKVAMLEDQLYRERETVEDLRKRLDRAEDRLTALMPPKQSINSQSLSSLWQRLIGGQPK